MATVQLRRGAQEDLAKADGSQLTAIANGLKKLQVSPDLRGEALRGDLAGYRKLILGNRNLRIVYKYDPLEDQVIVTAIGRRRDEEVYMLALSRISDDTSNGLGDVERNHG